MIQSYYNICPMIIPPGDDVKESRRLFPFLVVMWHFLAPHPPTFGS